MPESVIQFFQSISIKSLVVWAVVVTSTVVGAKHQLERKAESGELDTHIAVSNEKWAAVEQMFVYIHKRLDKIETLLERHLEKSE